jgi:hypothetical protein
MTAVTTILRRILGWDHKTKVQKAMFRRIIYHYLASGIAIYPLSDLAISFLRVPNWFKRKISALYVAKAAADLDCGFHCAAIEGARRAIALWPDVPGGYYVISNAMFPGDNYQDLLRKFHDWLRPKNYIEIGVNIGDSIALARFPTVAVGIDPTPRLLGVPRTMCKLFPLTSDAYFDERDVRADIEADTVELALIDGLHIFEQVLRDFINIERISNSKTIVLLHDCLVIDELTAERERKTKELWTGDVWKIISCLREFRPDLNVLVIPTAPTGLGVVTRLDPKSTVLTDHFDEIVSRASAYEFALAGSQDRHSDIMVANDWKEILERISVHQAQNQYGAMQ